jgi:hypothetical protein
MSESTRGDCDWMNIKEVSMPKSDCPQSRIIDAGESQPWSSTSKTSTRH